MLLKKRTLSPGENTTELGNTLYFPQGSEKLVTSPTQKLDIYLTSKNSQHLIWKKIHIRNQQIRQDLQQPLKRLGLSSESVSM